MSERKPERPPDPPPAPWPVQETAPDVIKAAHKPKREPWWIYVVLVFLTGAWSLCVTLLATFVLPLNPYVVWVLAWGVANLAVVIKVARGTQSQHTCNTKGEEAEIPTDRGRR